MNADTARVLGVSGGAVGIGVADLNPWLTMVSLLFAIGYTAWKWRKDYKKSQKDNDEKGSN